MKTIRSKSGPFTERPHFELQEIDRLCADELRQNALYPSTPSPIRIDRFIEKRFGVSPRYETLPKSVLGFTKFGPRGVEEVVVAAELDDEGTDVARRRLRTTLAHEAGHGLMHAYLFAVGLKPKSLFDDDSDEPQILCRDVDGLKDGNRYQGKWWEYQANRAIAALLLPRGLVEVAIESLLAKEGTFAKPMLPARNHPRAVRALSELFDVNAVVAHYQLSEMFPAAASGQLSL